MWFFTSPRNPYRETIEAKRSRRADALGHAPAFSADRHQKYLNATASQIVENIEAGTWTASGVLEAYVARAAQAQQAMNCLTEVFFEEAKEEALRLDAEFAATGRLKGPLHGVPISAKDQFDVKGFDSTIGYTQWANKPAEHDAAVVSKLRAAGAIIFAKTNVPQTLLAFESSNPLWGRTCNPWSAAHTSGGSSGGEGALLAADGAALGVGSDVGGSIRIPSGYCGILVLSRDRGACRPNPGFEAVRAVAGPMGRSVADLERMARVLFGERDASRQEYFPAPVPYRDVTLPKTLRIGYYLNDGAVKGSPACHRAVLETVEALRKEGHECIQIEPPDCALTTAYTGVGTLLVTLGPRLPGFIRAFAGWVIRNFIGDPIFASFLARSHHKSVLQYYNCVADKIAFERQTRTSLWDATEPENLALHAVIAPVQAIPALPHGGCDRLAPIACATLMYNIVDSPVGVWRATPGNGSKILEGDLYGPKGAYNVQAMEGLPVGVQVVGQPWGEEKVLAIMHVIDAALGPRGFGPGSWGPSKLV
ncbi:amidase signature domain-containing protein [Russula vinacea]|nr:amidase signature domain-containing protein [Russula vinacea]